MTENDLIYVNYTMDVPEHGVMVAKARLKCHSINRQQTLAELEADLASVLELKSEQNTHQVKLKRNSY